MSRSIAIAIVTISFVASFEYISAQAQNDAQRLFEDYLTAKQEILDRGYHRIEAVEFAALWSNILQDMQQVLHGNDLMRSKLYLAESKVIGSQRDEAQAILEEVIAESDASLGMRTSAYHQLISLYYAEQNEIGLQNGVKKLREFDIFLQETYGETNEQSVKDFVGNLYSGVLAREIQFAESFRGLKMYDSAKTILLNQLSKLDAKTPIMESENFSEPHSKAYLLFQLGSIAQDAGSSHAALEYYKEMWLDGSDSWYSHSFAVYQMFMVMTSLDLDPQNVIDGDEYHFNFFDISIDRQDDPIVLLDYYADLSTSLDRNDSYYANFLVHYGVELAAREMYFEASEALIRAFNHELWESLHDVHKARGLAMLSLSMLKQRREDEAKIFRDIIIEKNLQDKHHFAERLVGGRSW